MRWRPILDRTDGRTVRSVVVHDGTRLPAVGEVLVLGSSWCWPPPVAMRVEGVHGRTVWYVPWPSNEVPLGASYGWRLRRHRTAFRRWEERLELRRG